jgi:hypothetical protein
LTWYRASGISLVSGRQEWGSLSASSHGLAVWAGVLRKLDRAGRVRGSVELHQMIGEAPNGCATDTFAPFCHTFRATSLRIGVVLAPR